MRRTLVSLAAAAAVLAGCSGEPSQGGSPRRTPSAPVTPSASAGPHGRAVVRFDGAPPLTVEVANDPEERRVGLMHRSSLAPDTGMLFLYPNRVRGGFWMKNTLIPLSIAFVDGDTVVSTAEMVPCKSDPCPVYSPSGEYTFAVEAAAGFFPDHGVRAGTRVSVEGDVARAT